MLESFNTLNLNPALVSALDKQNITIPTDIQLMAIPRALQNKDIIMQSETGTGKTLAYLLPLFEKINTEIREMQAIILAPTHELAIQIHRVIENLSQDSAINVTSTPIIGNVNIIRQIEKLREKPHIIVGSAGRILELIKKKKISAHTIKTIVIDEADRLMDKHNKENILAVIKSTLKERQIMMCSATIATNTIISAKELMKSPEIIKVESKEKVPETIDHIYFECEQREKIDTLRKLIRIINPPKAFVFVNNSIENEVITDKLKYHGIKAESLHGANIKLDRKRVMDEFKSGKVQVLISSDLAARGLHIDGITHIFNMNIPENSKDYLHRVGRTGRAGESGMAVSIATTREILFIKMFEKELRIDIIKKDTFKDNIIDVKNGKR